MKTSNLQDNDAMLSIKLEFKFSREILGNTCERRVYICI